MAPPARDRRSARTRPPLTTILCKADGVSVAVDPNAGVFLQFCAREYEPDLRFSYHTPPPSSCTEPRQVVQAPILNAVGCSAPLKCVTLCVTQVMRRSAPLRSRSARQKEVPLAGQRQGERPWPTACAGNNEGGRSEFHPSGVTPAVPTPIVRNHGAGLAASIGPLRGLVASLPFRTGATSEAHHQAIGCSACSTLRPQQAVGRSAPIQASALRAEARQKRRASRGSLRAAKPRPLCTRKNKCTVSAWQ